MRPLLAIAIDTTFGEIAADLLIIIFIAFNAWLGWRRGLVRRALTFAGLYAGVLAANYLGNPFATFFGVGDRLTANSWWFVAVFVVTVGMVEVMTALYHDQLQNMMVVTFDRIAGLIAGIIVGLLEIGIIFCVAIDAGQAPSPSISNTVPANYQDASNAIRNATFGEFVFNLRPGIEALFGPALPKNGLTNHLQEGTQKGTTNPS